MLRLLGYTFIGAAAGYAAAVVAINLEDRPLFALRSWATGETTPMEIAMHPANRWVYAVAVVAPILLGASLGVGIAVIRQAGARKRLSQTAE